jgi:shikimate kinase
MQWMKENGSTIFVRVSPTTAFHRIMNAKRKRPLVYGKSEDELRQYVENHFNSRLPFYEQADFTVKGENFDIEEVIDYLSQL